MIKKIDEIKVRDINRMEESGQLSQFKSKYNILPVRFFMRRIEKLILSIYGKLNDNGINEDIDDLEYQTFMILKINECYAALLFLQKKLITETDYKTFLSRFNLNRYWRRKFKLVDKANPNIKICVNIIKQELNVDIKTVADLKTAEEKIKLLNEKYNELFVIDKPKKTEGEKFTTMEYAAIIVGYIGGDIVGLGEMRLDELFVAKKQADKKQKAEAKQLEKLRNGRN